MSSPQTLEPSAFFDIVIIGSGPAALAVVTRILESRPAALYTEEEHSHLHWLRKSSIARPLLKTKKRGRGNEKIADGNILASLAEAEGSPVHCAACIAENSVKILVVDKLGGWMANWDRLFKAYDISHLRSPLFFHPAPADIDSLLAFAERNNRNKIQWSSNAAKYLAERCRFCLTTHGKQSSNKSEDADLIEIGGCVGKEISKHKRKKQLSSHSSIGPAVNERDRKDYFTPSTALFRDFVQSDLVDRYGLGDYEQPWRTISSIIKDDAADKPDTLGCANNHGDKESVVTARGEVTDITWQPLHLRGAERFDGFSITMSDHTMIGAHAIICAGGPGISPAIPQYLQSTLRRPPNTTHEQNETPKSVHGPGCAHSSALGMPGYRFPPPSLLKPEAAPLLIVGGGLTSAQIADVAIRRGVRNVILLMRRYMKIKPFDVSLDWIGRYANLQRMMYWQEDDPENRLEMLRNARNGGSITPGYAKLMKKYEEVGRLRVVTCSEIKSAKWLKSNQAQDPNDGEWNVQIQSNRCASDAPQDEPNLRAGYIVAATGSAPNIDTVPFLQNILKSHPIDTHGGFPFVTTNLQHDDLPLFYTGALSALQIGPGAFNLEGMRSAADRIAIRLQELGMLGSSNAGLEANTEKGKTSEGVENERQERASERDDTEDGYTHYRFGALPMEVSI